MNDARDVPSESDGHRSAEGLDHGGFQRESSAQSRLVEAEALPLESADGEADESPRYLVGIGASAGGLEALERLFEVMPEDTGCAFIVVQHLSPDFRSLMGEVLARWTRMRVRTVEHGMPVRANTIYLMPPRTEMIISSGNLLLTQRERSDELRLPIDQFLRSLARDAGGRAVAVILSGTGSDGSRGIREVHDAGGFVLAQSLETAKFDGMPKSALETSVVNRMVSPEEMPRELLRHIHHPRAVDVSEDDTGEMRPIFRALRERFGIDFANYKSSTVARRTEHRMQLSRVTDLVDYVRLLEEDPAELESLHHDLLIGVTNFFRDPEAFERLRQQVLPGLIEGLEAGDELRAWVAGCATGEEAYSVAMVVQEAIEQSGKDLHAKIFATDVHEGALAHATTGIYSEASVASVPERLRRKYFTAVQDGYRVQTELRNSVVFALHDVTKDAPFTRIAFISCRNLLIYLVPAAQTKALGLFHFGLKTGGVLLLGPSENLGELSGEFETLDTHWKLFRKRRDANLISALRLPLSKSLLSHWPAGRLQRDAGLTDVFAQVLDEALPPSVLVNAQYEVVHSFGEVSKYLRIPSGAPTTQLLEMLGDELRLAVGAGLHRAARDQQRATLQRVMLAGGDPETRVNLAVVPIAAGRRWGNHYLVQFEEVRDRVEPTSVDADLDLEEAARDHIRSLEAELRWTKENLQATIEELETSNEELQATNEELLASNEELQSTNEELHSVNEELYTVNSEYQRKIQELTELTHDMDNLLDSTDVHTIFLDEELRIRRFTPKMAEVFHIIEADAGRSIHGFMHSIQCTDLSRKLRSVVAHREYYEEEVKTGEGGAYLMRMLPYRGDPGQGGVVLTLVDITGVKEAETRFSSAMEVSPNGMLMVCARGLITQVNSELERIFGYTREEMIGEPLEMLIDAQTRDDHRDMRRDYFRDPYVIRRMGGMPYVWGQHRDGRKLPLDVHVRPISTPSGRQAIASVVDVSQHHQLEENLREQVNQRDRFLATLSHELRNPMGAILTAASVLRREELGDEPHAVRVSESDERPSRGTEPCDVINRQATRMARLLDDLLDVARVTQGKITLRMEILDLVEVCHSSMEAVRPMLVSHRHECVLQMPDEPVWVRGDRVRLVQIIENLLTNAIKYTDDDGHIKLSLTRTKAHAFITVRDDGRGMSEELLQTVFDMFVQSDNTLDRREGGMGLGLTLVRSLVEMHDGKITAASSGVGLGSEFEVQLPLSDEPIAAHAVPEPWAVGRTSKRIVLVEDDDDARAMMTMLLRHHGHDVVGSAADGISGMEQVLKLRPDVALLDIGLPKLDGYAVARRLREQLGEQVFLIALTGYGRNEDRETVVEAGFDQHLVKPVDVQMLDDILQRVPAR